MVESAENRGERIAKFLSRAGISSRRDAEALIEAGKVRMNNELVTHPAVFVQPGDLVVVDGKAVSEPERTRLWRYHKPDGLVTTHKDPEGRATVFEHLPRDLPRVISVGRLDLTSEGLLLLTNDGALSRQLELPATGWLRRYRVRVHGGVDPKKLVRLAEGMVVDGVQFGPIEAAVDSTQRANTWLSISLREGKNREIRRVMDALLLPVTRLIRVAYGPFQLGNLARGEAEEVNGKILREQVPGLGK
jgi:23S rRNA pseudouridine2605 synthase